jgi:hypothetical protein
VLLPFSIEKERLQHVSVKDSNILLIATIFSLLRKKTRKNLPITEKNNVVSRDLLSHYLQRAYMSSFIGFVGGEGQLCLQFFQILHLVTFPGNIVIKDMVVP